MANYKQIQAKFWQNDFVLELTPEERYFYMYLITNTMTTLCGIYRFNLKLAVLETGLSAEVINKHLNDFESSKKIIISKTSKEIMIVNFMKHNFRMNKRIISSINAELKEVKDKELLKRFFEICNMRQYYVEEMFKGIILPSAIEEVTNNIVQAMPKDFGQLGTDTEEPSQDEVNNIGQAVPQDSVQKDLAAERTTKEEANNAGQAIPQTSEHQEVDTQVPSQDNTNESQEPVRMLFTGFNGASTNSRSKRRQVKQNKEIEEIEVEFNDIVVEDDMEEPIKGSVTKSWSFTDSGGRGILAASR